MKSSEYTNEYWGRLPQGAVIAPDSVLAWCVANAVGANAYELITPTGISTARNVLPRISEVTIPTKTAITAE